MPTMLRKPQSGLRVRQERLLLGVVLVLLGLLAVWDRFGERARIEAEQRHLLAVQALAVDEHLARQLVATRAALVGVRDELTLWASDDLWARGSRRLEALCAAMPGVQTMLLLDRQGYVLAASRPEFAGRDLGDRLYFQFAQQPPDANRLQLSAPYVGSAGRHAMSLSVSVLASDGSFAGVVVARLDPEYFRVLLRSTHYAPDVSAAVAHGDGLLMLVEPADGLAVGRSLDQPGSSFRHHVDSTRAASMQIGLDAITGEQRLMAHRTVRPAALALDKPLVVTVSRNLQSMFAPWWQQSLAYAAVYALVVSTALIALIAVQRRRLAVERLQAQHDELARRSAMRLGLALRGADLGSWDFDLRNGATTVNERWNAMLGLPHRPAYPSAEHWITRIHPEDSERVLAAQQAHLDGRTERFEQTYRIRHADGHWVWILDRGQVLERDAQGVALRMVGTHMDITERMLEHLALERSEQSLATTLYSIGDAVIATDPQGRVVRMNATAERLTGWPVAEAVGQPLDQVFRIVNARTREPVADPVQRATDRRETVDLASDTLLLGRDGGEYQIADSAAPIRAPDGEITGVVLVFSDITERQRIQQALRANEARVRSLLDNLGSGVVVHGPDTQVLDANPAACRIIGLTPDQMKGRMSIDPHWAFLEEDGSAMAHERFPVSQVLGDGCAVNNLVLGVRRPDLARPLWVLVNAYPVRDGDDRICQVVVTFTEITERKEAEEELRLLAAAVARLNEVVMITDADLEPPAPRIVFVNDAFERSTGWRRDEVIGKSPRLLQGPNTDAGEVSRIGAALRRGEPVHAELINYTRQGAEFWVEVDIVPLADRNGRVTHLVAVERDITERKRAEAERLVLEQQLRDAQKMESIGTLAGGIAHDFNNILAAILGNVALARADLPAGHAVVASLDQINRAGLRARNLVQQILAFSRREHHGLSEVLLGPVVCETLGLLRSTLPAGIGLDAVVPDEPLAIRGDATQLQQVLLNLCTNAWHALPDQGGRIEVGFERASVDEALQPRIPEMAPGDCAHLWVSDNGSGIDEATRLRIFDPFFTTKTVGQGTGLGLSVVHGIVRAHGGAVAVDTAPGRGSTFHVYFPLLEAGVVGAAPADEPTRAASGAGQHVLYIDDDQVMVLMVERLLARAGFRVTVETDPGAAIARVRAQPQAFDAVVTDFNMPGSSGLDVAQQIAGIRPDLPVVISSGFLSDELRARAAQQGVRALLPKENSFDELAPLLQRLFAEESTGRAGGADQPSTAR